MVWQRVGLIGWSGYGGMYAAILNAAIVIPWNFGMILQSLCSDGGWSELHTAAGEALFQI